jgi:hypothetical protein
MPSPIAYWILDAVLLGLGLWGLYAVENIRGELDEEVVTVPAEATSTLTGD